MRPVKHKFRRLEVGESYEVTDPPKWLRAAVYTYGAECGKHFSACKLADGSLEIRRFEFPLSAADISLHKSKGASIAHARRRAQRSEV